MEFFIAKEVGVEDGPRKVAKRIKWSMYRHGDSSLVLTAEDMDDPSGNPWNVFILDAKTSDILRCSNIPEKLGLKVDDRGQVKIRSTFRD